MEYRNRKTGFVISTASEIAGADWVALKTDPPAEPKPKAEKATGKATGKAVKPKCNGTKTAKKAAAS